MEETLIKIMTFLGNKVILLTLLPSLLLNIIIDSTEEILKYKSETKKIINFSGLIPLLGILFIFIYYFILDLQLDDALLHGLAISGLSYLFYKLDIYDFIKNIISKKLGDKDE